MRNAILLHGLPSEQEYYNPDYPSASNSHWFPWLQKELLINEIKADTPEVVRPFEMEWNSWVQEVERFPLLPDTTLVGHSMGGGFWVRYMSERPDLYVDKLVLVAPWLNIDHEYDSNFFDFEVDTALINRTKDMIIFYSDDDNSSIQDTIVFLRQKFPKATFKEFQGYGHFTQRSLPDNRFQELLDVIL